MVRLLRQPDEVLVEDAATLAEDLLAAARTSETAAERRRRRRLARLLDDPAGRHFVLALTDQVVRIHDARRAAIRFRDIVTAGGPAFAGPLDRAAALAGARLAPVFPKTVTRLALARLRRESAGVILPAERQPLAHHLAERRRNGFRVNVNVLGEAVLGEAEAMRRTEQITAALERPDVDYVSVKVSAVCSQLSILAFDHSVARVVDRLRPLYERAAAATPRAFVNLDMEEYRDLHLTVAVFRALLDEPALAGLDAGIAIQAYLPDSHDVAAELCEWAADRWRRAGGRTKIRLVKGANLAMEQVEAELRGWPQAPYPTKADVDASYKRLLDVLLDDRWAGAVRVGVASHNLFDVAWALTLADGADDERLDLEMLAGMAEPEARVVRDRAGAVVLYTPVVRRDDFESAIAYLARRLDENTGPENFLRAMFAIEAGSTAFADQRRRFAAAVADRHTVSLTPRRCQDRAAERPSTDPAATFGNAPDTDFTSAANRAWIADALAAAWATPPPTVPAVVDGADVEGSAWAESVDPSEPERRYRYALADMALVERAVEVAWRGGAAWARRPAAERRAVLARVADVMAAARGETVATMVGDAGKTVAEADPEVSEAVDYARYYAQSTRTIETLEGDGLSFEPLGTVVVASPWNFPYAIPAGGVLAALAAGNAVILKPAPETVATAALVARHCWAGGVPTDALQFLPTPEDDVGRRLLTHPDVHGVVLTGAYDTARLFRSWKPELHLQAETSGKNAIVVTAAADIDGAVRDIVQSAFGHAGQKCSAASLAIVEASVYDDPKFRRQLADAVQSLVVGSAWEAPTVVGPLIRPPSGPLAKALRTLDPGEMWLVAPRQLDRDGYRWSPGVKLGVRPGSWFHTTECFGPVLGVMRARHLDEAIEWQNATPFGLTGGLQTLDDAEVARWLDAVDVGNAYVNRGVTGAIVRRQPFGGRKRSAVGPTAKAGGPSYALTLGRWRTERRVPLAEARASFERWWAELRVDHDASGLRAERNVLRHQPLRDPVVLRAGDDADPHDVAIALAAADVVGVDVRISSNRTIDLPGDVRVAVEDERTLAARVAGSGATRVRVVGGAGRELLAACFDADIDVDPSPVVAHGRIELLRWTHEQAVSETRHRLGRLLDQ